MENHDAKGNGSTLFVYVIVILRYNIKTKFKMAMKYFLMLLLLFFAGCKKYNDNQFIGRWIDSYDLGILGVQNTELKLYEDKSCNLKLFNMEMNGTWKVDDDTLILELKSKEDSEDSSPSVSKFKIVRLNDKELFLKKPNTNDVSEYYKK